MSLATRFIDILLPAGGYVVALAEMYFDESEDSNEKLLCVAGYLFKKENCQSLEQKWNVVLKRENLPYFRMVDCAHGNGVFKGFEQKRRSEIQKELFDLLKAHMESGISISFDLRYSNLCPSAKHHGIDIVSPYALCAYFCMMQGRKWAHDNQFTGEIAYFFEAGHKHQTQANHIMKDIFSVPELRSHYRYGAHAFVPKEKSGALQCGDILAWQWLKNVKDRRKGKNRTRADLWSLLEKPHFTIHFDEYKLNEFRKVIIKNNEDAEIKRISELAGF